MAQQSQKSRKVPREYQKLSYEAAKRRNTIVHLDTGLGKTHIACLVIQNALSLPANKGKLIIFLAPQAPLVEQQARVIAHEVPSAIVRKLHGQMHSYHGEWTAEEWRHYLTNGGNVFAMTPAIFNDMLIHGHIWMEHVALIVLDECHHVSGRDEYRLIMEYHYKRCPISLRPQIFGMSAPLIKGTSSIHKISQKVNELSAILDCDVYQPKSSDVELYNVHPEVEYVTYGSDDNDIDNLSKFEHVWPSDPGLNEERWQREQDHFYRVLDELGERAAVIAMESFVQTNEMNDYLHKFPLEKIVHDKLLRQEYGIDADYQNKKKQMKKNWYFWKKKYMEKQKNLNTFDNDKAQPINCEEIRKLKYHSKRINNGPKTPRPNKKKKTNKQKLNEWIEALNNQTANDSELKYFGLSSKCKALFNVLHNEIERVGTKNFKTLILVQRRKVAEILSILINQSPLSSKIVCDFIISAISKGGAMNAKLPSSQQKQRLARFHITDEADEDRIDCLVATSLAEEGLDVPSCRLVVKFNETMSAKQDVQCKGRARHTQSRYIHIIHELDANRQKEKLKKYQKFQKQVDKVNDGNTQKNDDEKKGQSMFDAKTFDRGLLVESTHAFMYEKAAYCKIHEIYNRCDHEINAQVPWDSFAESPFSKNNFEQVVVSGICGMWKLKYCKLSFIDASTLEKMDNFRLKIERVRGSDDTMKGVLYVTNDEYENEYKLFKERYRENKNDRKFERELTPPLLPNVLSEIKLKYDNVKKVRMEFMKNESIFVGEIAEDRNNIKVIDNEQNVAMELIKYENVTTLNEDPNAFVHNYKLILKLRDIPQSFVNNVSQRDVAKQWFEDRLNMALFCKMLNIDRDSVQMQVRIVKDMAISFKLCLSEKIDKESEDQNVSKQISWNDIDELNNLMDQFQTIFGDDAVIKINETNSKFLQITTYKLQNYIRDRQQINDIPKWVQNKLRKVNFNGDKYAFSTFEEFFPWKRSIRVDFRISGINFEQTEFKERLDFVREKLTKKFGQIHLFLPGQSNWKKSDKRKDAKYKRDKIYFQKVTLPKLSAYYNHLPEITLIGDVRFNSKSSRDSVAFKAIKYLYSKGVLDDNFRVKGRKKAPRAMSMMSTANGTDQMETIMHTAKPRLFRVYRDTYVDQLHSIQFLDVDSDELLHEFGLLTTEKIQIPIEFYLYQPRDDSKKIKVFIEFVEECDRTSDFDAHRLSYHTNLMALLGYNDTMGYNCNDKNCVVVPLNQRHLLMEQIHYLLNIDVDIIANIISFLPRIDVKYIEHISNNPWSEFVNIHILILFGKHLTLSMVGENQNGLIELFKDLNCSIQSIEKLDQLPFVNENTTNDQTIIMIKFVGTIKETKSDQIKYKSDLFKMSKAESMQRHGYGFRLNIKLLKKILNYPSNDLHFIFDHRDEAMIQYRKWTKLNEYISNKQCLTNVVVRNHSSNSYYYDLSPSKLTLKSKIGGGFSYLNYYQNKMNSDQNINENEILYSSRPLLLRPEDATIHQSRKTKKASNNSGGTILIAPQMCRVVPVDKMELICARYLPCTLWKLEKISLMNDFKHFIHFPEYNSYLLHQCCSLPSIDMNLHAKIGRIYFFGDQLIKYCGAIEAYSMQNECNQTELTRYVHANTSNANLCDRAKANGFLKYFITQPFDAKNYEIANFSALNNANDYHRVSRKSIADMIEGMATALFYNEHICASAELSQTIIDEGIGDLNLSEMKIGDSFSMCAVREFICYFLQFQFYDQPTFPFIWEEMRPFRKKLLCKFWKNKQVFTADDQYNAIIKCLKAIKESMSNENDTEYDEKYEMEMIDIEAKEQENDSFEWTAEIMSTLSHLCLSQQSSSRDIEDVIFQIHDKCQSKQWGMENLKVLSLLNKVRAHVKKIEKMKMWNTKSAKDIYNPYIYQYDDEVGLGTINERESINSPCTVYGINARMIMNKDIMIPPGVNKYFGLRLYKAIILFYNKHCVDKGIECTKYLMNKAIIKCILPLFVYDGTSICYKNNFTLDEVENVLNRFLVLCDDTFPIFVLNDYDRINAIEQVMNYSFYRKDLIFAATTHSAMNTDKTSICNYQRLEFIGDASIGVCVCQYLFQTFVNFEQGRLSHTRSAIVCNHYLARKLMKRFKRHNLDIKKFITVISSKEREDLCEYIENFDFEADDLLFCLNLLTVSRSKQPFCAKILADIYEALVGAILIDSNGNLETVWDVIQEDFLLNDEQIELINAKYLEAQMIQMTQ